MGKGTSGPSVSDDGEEVGSERKTKARNKGRGMGGKVCADDTAEEEWRRGRGRREGLKIVVVWLRSYSH